MKEDIRANSPLGWTSLEVLTLFKASLPKSAFFGHRSFFKAVAYAASRRISKKGEGEKKRRKRGRMNGRRNGLTSHFIEGEDRGE